MSTPVYDVERLVQIASQHFHLPLDSIHGLAHWVRVYTLGQYLCDQTGSKRSVDRDVVGLFAILHDIERTTDGADPQHGSRAADFIRTKNGDWFTCTPKQLDLLARACADHSKARSHDDPTIQLCWDSDRLDLWRIGIEPNINRLSSDVAKRAETIEMAQQQFKAYPRFELITTPSG
ncbi:HD domain-containing protein [Magnetovibrio sp. PR-2]|uniref:HD domain-containing protein n=1 Tax=Magnetovibrio sp. PR-2 TaxID=3120356 RepID=UPI002FCE3A5E